MSDYQATITKKTIKDWHEDDQPREKLLNRGAENLTDAELLAILIRNGSREASALDIARMLIEKYGGLNALIKRELKEFQEPKGMGMVKAVTLAAAFEISKRVQASPFKEKKVIRSPSDIADYFIPRLRAARTESFYVLLLNSANQVFKHIKVSEGTVNASIVHPREVFRQAITESAVSVILLHNHPSGNKEPSKEDIKITRQLVKAGEHIDIKVLDHIIIAGEEFTSLANLGLI
jgi:DNA repair protein RadC